MSSNGVRNESVNELRLQSLPLLRKHLGALPFRGSSSCRANAIFDWISCVPGHLSGQAPTLPSLFAGDPGKPLPQGAGKPLPQREGVVSLQGMLGERYVV